MRELGEELLGSLQKTVLRSLEDRQHTTAQQLERVESRLEQVSDKFFLTDVVEVSCFTFVPPPHAPRRAAPRARHSSTQHRTAQHHTVEAQQSAQEPSEVLPRCLPQ